MKSLYSPIIFHKLNKIFWQTESRDCALRFTHEAVLASPEQVVDFIQRELEQDARSLTLQLSRLQDTQGG